MTVLIDKDFLLEELQMWSNVALAADPYSAGRYQAIQDVINLIKSTEGQVQTVTGGFISESAWNEHCNNLASEFDGWMEIKKWKI